MLFSDLQEQLLLVLHAESALELVLLVASHSLQTLYMLDK
jgi:hypothetical protein